DLGDARTLDGAVGLSCGGCGAPLRPAPGAHTVECAFCHLVSRVPRELVPLRADVAPTPFWLAFSGPSMLRRELVRGEEGAVPIRTAAEVPGSGWRGFAASVVVAGGMLAGTGVVLFVLLRLGIVPLSAIVP
ncbi:MAG: zinc finger domain-containing protein, partial [Myxococcota bacterium]